MSLLQGVRVTPLEPLPEAVEVFIQRNVDPGGCWLWLGKLRPSGYGIYRWQVPGRTNSVIVQAHRLVWHYYRGRIPSHRVDPVTGKREPVELDHLCRVRMCVNPEHLEVVTKSENLRRRSPR